LVSFAKTCKKISINTPILKIEKLWDIFEKNQPAIEIDFELLTSERTSQALPSYVTSINPENIFIEEGAILNPCILNASTGSIYIAKDAEIMEGCMVRGP